MLSKRNLKSKVVTYGITAMTTYLLTNMKGITHFPIVKETM